MRYPKYKILLFVVDYILVRISFSAALQLRGISIIKGEQWFNYVQSGEFLFLFVYSLFIILLFQSKGLYKINVILTRSLQIVAIVQSMVYAVAGLAIVAFFIHSRWILDSRLAVAYFSLIAFATIVGYRIFIFRPLYTYLNKKRVLKKNVRIIGSNLEAKNLAIRLSVNNEYGLRLVGFVDDHLPVGSKVFEDYSILGKLKDVPGLIKAHRIHEVIVTVSDVSYNHFLKIVDICKKSSAEIRVTSSLFDIIHRKVLPESYFNVPVISFGHPAPPHSMILSKRIFDFIASATMLLVLSLPLLIVGAIIKLSSKGPVLFRQGRLGKDGKPFKFYKFRTMYPGSERDTARARRVQEFIRKGSHSGNGSSKVVNEEMITRFGRFLRSTSIDELPQLLNVLKGEMSLVGPRPCLPYEYEVYDEWHKRRLSVLPGCTGLWQVSSRSEVGFDDMVLLDLFYIDNMSPWFDLQLMLKTIPVMVFRRGAK